MTKELINMELFDRWTDTTNREEYIRLGKRLFPGEMTDEEWEKQAEEALSGYPAV